MRSFFLLGGGLLLAFLPGTVGAQSSDLLTDNKGGDSFGTVIEMSPTEVVFDMRGDKKKFQVNTISELKYGGEPADLRRARNSLAEGGLQSAMDDLKKIDVSQIQRDVTKQDIQFYLAYCAGKMALVGGGDKTEAVTQLRNFLTEHPGNYHYFEVVELIGDLAVALQSAENADKYYAMLADAPWPEYQLRANVLRGRALVAAGDHAQASSRFDAVLGASVDTPEASGQKQLAQVGKAQCLAEMGQPDQGIELVEKVIAENDPQAKPELFGRAYNALGTCYLKTGRPKDALLQFLHVDLLFYSDPDVHAEALYHLSHLWQEAKKSDRAIRARSMLQNRYAGSRWAKQQ